jgi:CMP-N-acetylneuraminic acid synthetase
MRVLGLVPARGSSQRVSRKNLAVLGGSTLVRRALEVSVAAACFETVALSSDDPEILAEAYGLPEVVQLERTAELASETAPVYEVVIDVLGRLDPERRRYDAVAIVQCTSPFTAPEDIAGAVELLDRSGAGSVVSVVRIESALHPLKLKRLEGDRLLPYLEDDAMLPSHELPPLWVRNGSVYVTRRSEIERGNLIAEDVRGYEMPAARSFDIDTPRDLAFAQFLLERGESSSSGTDRR